MGDLDSAIASSWPPLHRMRAGSTIDHPLPTALQAE